MASDRRLIEPGERSSTVVGGWLIGVLLEVAGASRPVRHYYAIGHEDRAKAEWIAVDHAAREGHVASSPSQGMEPVAALRGLTLTTMAMQGLARGEVRALGWRSPRRWLTP
jgi:hypothetical protein